MTDKNKTTIISDAVRELVDALSRVDEARRYAELALIEMQDAVAVLRERTAYASKDLAARIAQVHNHRRVIETPEQLGALGHDSIVRGANGVAHTIDANRRPRAGNTPGWLLPDEVRLPAILLWPPSSEATP